jgi:hypothetical protein
MALSAKTHVNLIDALSSKAAALELEAIVAARAGTPSRVLTQALSDAMTSASTRGGSLNAPTAFEVLAALVSGANLSLKARQKLLIMMAGDATPTGGAHAAGNELINFIQSVPQSSNTIL